MNSISINTNLHFKQSDCKRHKANANFQSILGGCRTCENVKNNRAKNFKQQKNKMEPLDQSLIESCPLPITDQAST